MGNKIKHSVFFLLLSAMTIFGALQVHADTIICNDHKMEWVVTRKATCAAEGEKVYKCKTCGKTEKTAKINKKKHSYKWETTKKATCAEAGVKSYKCKNCGHVSKTKPIKKKKHSYKWETTKAAVCGEAGEKVYKCKNCGHISKKKKTKKLEHKYITKTTTTKKDNVKYKGKKYYKYTATSVIGCSRCDKTFYVINYNYVTNGASKIRKGCAAKCYYADDSRTSYKKVQTATFSNKKVPKAGKKNKKWEISGLKWKDANPTKGEVKYTIKRSKNKEKCTGWVQWGDGASSSGSNPAPSVKPGGQKPSTGYGFSTSSKNENTNSGGNSSSSGTGTNTSSTSPKINSKLVVNNDGEITDVANGGAKSIKEAETTAKKGPNANSTVPVTDEPTVTTSTKSTTSTTSKSSGSESKTTSTSSSSKPSSGSTKVTKGTERVVGPAKYKVTGGSSVTYEAPASPAIAEIKVPEKIKIEGKTYKVTKIAPRAFAKNKSIRSVVIPKSVKSIGARAFYNCSNLRKITIKTKYLNSKRVGKEAFKGTHKKATYRIIKSKYNAYKKMLKKKGASKKAKWKKISK